MLKKTWLKLKLHQHLHQINKSGFWNKIREKKLPDWAESQIQEQYLPYDVICSDQTAKGALGSSQALFCYKGVQLKTYCAKDLRLHERFIIISHVISWLLSSKKQESGNWIADFGDTITSKDTNLVPLLLFAKRNTTPGILIPDHQALSGQNYLMHQIHLGNNKVLWGKKQPKLFWRGATTGGWYGSDKKYLNYPRYRLVEQSINYPDWIDARFCQSTQGEKSTFDYMRKNEFFGKFYPIAKHLEYKYQILVDGNTSSFSRAIWQLFSNCLVFKQESNYVQWFYAGLVPWKHYVPIKENMSDLLEKIQWAENNEPKVLSMIKEANKFARLYLTDTSHLWYLYHVLNHHCG